MYLIASIEELDEFARDRFVSKPALAYMHVYYDR